MSRMCVFLNISVLQGGVVSTSPNPPAGGTPLVGYPRLLIQFIRSYPPYRRPFLYPQPEYAPCRGNSDPLHSVTDYYVITLVINPSASVGLCNENKSNNKSNKNKKHGTYQFGSYFCDVNQMAQFSTFLRFHIKYVRMMLQKDGDLHRLFIKEYLR